MCCSKGSACFSTEPQLQASQCWSRWVLSIRGSIGFSTALGRREVRCSEFCVFLEEHRATCQIQEVTHLRRLLQGYLIPCIHPASSHRLPTVGQALLAVRWVLEMTPGLLQTDLPSWSSLSSQSEPRDTGKQDHFRPHGDAERKDVLEGHAKVASQAP